MIKFLKRKKFSMKHIIPGDTISLRYDNKVLLSHEVTKLSDINAVAILEFKDEFDMDNGIAGVFGEEKY